MGAMPEAAELWPGLAVALGIGLLIGVERERRKGARHASAGVRTFALTALLGALCLHLGAAPLLAVGTVAVAAFAALDYLRSGNGRLTTEMALLLTLLLGALATRQPAPAAALGVIIAMLLAERTRIHFFVSRVITDAELHDTLVLASAVLVVLPLIPNRFVGPFSAINPYSLWTIVVLTLSINAIGQLALRLLGARYGLALTGSRTVFRSEDHSILARRWRWPPRLAWCCWPPP